MNVGQRMFGLETEYALSAIGSSGARVSQGRALSGLMQLAYRNLPALPDKHSPGVFLQNGSRLYIDSGGHPEFSTCEVVNPWDACRYALAGDRILAELADQLVAREKSIDHVILTRCNVCYAPSRSTTWGCHESYTHRADPVRLSSALIPHLVSRIIYTGSGGFDSRSAGCTFMVSPRVAHLERVVSEESTHNRGIFHQKNEPLSEGGYHRLHVLCGESVSSHTALWLKMAVTCLVVAMTEAGFEPCRAISLREPLTAMRRFSTDLDCNSQVQTADGRWITALEMQRHILAEIEAHQDHPVMPPWTEQVCQRLRHILERLEKGPANAATTLDWAIKLSLYREVARRSGISLESLAQWSDIFTALSLALRFRTEEGRRRPLTADVLGSNSPVSDDVARLTPLVRRKKLNWDQFEDAIRLRDTLFELDTRFAQLGPQGIFNAMDACGALDHHVPGVNNIEHAIANPPAQGRARLRGEFIRRFHGRRERYICDWTGVWDYRARRRLDLSNPFPTEQDLPEEDADL